MPERNENQNNNWENQPQDRRADPLQETPEMPAFGWPPAMGSAPSGPNGPLPLPTPSLPFTPSEPDSPVPLPMPPLAENPSYPNMNIPAYPDMNIPSYPNINIPSYPGENGRPPVVVYPVPITPGTNQGNQGFYCTVRFLHAVVGYGSVNVMVGNNPVVSNLGYGESSSYTIEPAGFQTIQVSSARMPSVSVVRESFLLTPGNVYTIALVNGINGVAMVMISGMPCVNQRQKFSCVRVANLSYNSPALNVETQGGIVKFEDIRFKAVSAYKQIMQGSQTFYVTETRSGVPAFDANEWIEPRKMYTFYIVGDAYGYPELSMIFTEDYPVLNYF